jgi:hypothetical protein
MAHFAKIENGIVTNVVVVDNAHENNGQEYLNSLGLEGTWIQTSYNATFGNKFAGIGDTWTESNGFRPAKPQDGKKYAWSDELKNWVEA